MLGRRRGAVALVAGVSAVAAAAVAVASGVFGGAAPAGAVAHGTVVQQGSYRFAAKLTFAGIPRTDGTRYDSACSGALIAPRWVISAGHCFHDAARNRVSGPPPYQSSTVTVGRANVNTGPGEVRTIMDVRQSPTSDVALVELSTPVAGITPLGLPGRAPRVGEEVRLAGFGATGSTNPAPSDILRTGLFRITSVSTQIVGVTGRAPAADTSACLYDSGAPYFRSDFGLVTLVSVESSGPDCPHAQQETTSRVDTLLPWIRLQMRG